MTASSAVETYSPDDMLANSEGVKTDTGTLVSGQNLARGAVVGRITASGKFTLCNSGAADGSQTPVAIIAEAMDASGGDKTCQLYTGGCFRDSALTWHGSFTTLLQKKAAFDRTPISIR